MRYVRDVALAVLVLRQVNDGPRGGLHDPPARRPRIRATTPNPSRSRGDADGSVFGDFRRYYVDIPDPPPRFRVVPLVKPPWWRRHARRIWRDLIPRGFE